jgi:hypothetical protein
MKMHHTRYYWLLVALAVAAFLSCWTSRVGSWRRTTKREETS